MRIFLMVVALFLSGSANAGVATINKAVNTHKIAGELKTATGFDFERLCSTCPVQGKLDYNGSGVLTVTVFETITTFYVLRSTYSYLLNNSTATFSDDLKTAISTTGENHVP